MLAAASQAAKPTRQPVGEPVEPLLDRDAGSGRQGAVPKPARREPDVVPTRGERGAQTMVVRPRIAARVDEDDAHRINGSESPAGGIRRAGR